MGEELAAGLNRDLAAWIRERYGVESRLELQFERLYLKLLLPPVRRERPGGEETLRRAGRGGREARDGVHRHGGGAPRLDGPRAPGPARALRAPLRRPAGGGLPERGAGRPARGPPRRAAGLPQGSAQGPVGVHLHDPAPRGGGAQARRPSAGRDGLRDDRRPAPSRPSTAATPSTTSTTSTSRSARSPSRSSTCWARTSTSSPAAATRWGCSEAAREKMRCLIP